jgi:prephenate dehydrogenase
MRIFILGAGHMGRWLSEELNHDHEVAVFDKNIKNMKHLFNVTRFTDISELKEFNPELVINAVSLNKTIEGFNLVDPYISDDCIISDIASVKHEIVDYYKNQCKRRFVSTHPMFGPTFANLNNLSAENVIIIKESDEEGKKFFTDFFKELNLNIFEYSFDDHDKSTAYSLSTPFASTMVFAGCMKNQEAPGTTFKKHMDIAKKLLAEDDYLLSEIMFNPYTIKQIENINSKLSYLTHIINQKDHEEMKKFINKLRDNLK